jgi:ABC-type multidrug transport system ATPase subunit
MRITLNDIGKRYNAEWIFRKVNHEFVSGDHCVILGGNGSGKSTLLQVIAGSMMSSEGMMSHVLNGKTISDEKIYRHTSFASPYLDLFEEYTLREAVAFHAKFKPLLNGINAEKFIALTQLEKAANKQIKYYSSGMKQRVRLALAILSDTPLLLLDEPASNLDRKAIDWYQQLVNDHSFNRLILVCSNQQEYEYSFCKKELHIENFKQ